MAADPIAGDSAFLIAEQSWKIAAVHIQPNSTQVHLTCDTRRVVRRPTGMRTGVQKGHESAMNARVND
jgi:hypothetical protein